MPTWTLLGVHVNGEISICLLNINFKFLFDVYQPLRTVRSIFTRDCSWTVCSVMNTFASDERRSMVPFLENGIFLVEMEIAVLRCYCRALRPITSIVSQHIFVMGGIGFTLWRNMIIPVATGWLKEFDESRYRERLMLSPFDTCFGISSTGYEVFPVAMSVAASNDFVFQRQTTACAGHI